MQNNICLLSEKGILDINGKPLTYIPFQGTRTITGDVCNGKVTVIVDKHEVWIYSEERWSKVLSTEIKLNCVHWTLDSRILVGTECARLAWVSEGELNFIKSFDEVPERKSWYTPWGGPPDVRSLAVSPDGTIYADIHVGWIVRSRDGGKTWINLQEGLDIDVHQVAVHPHKQEVVFAATANGFYISHDHGDTFVRQGDGMPYYYQRACTCLADRDVYLASTSQGPHGQSDALLFRSEDEGKSWTVTSGLPEKISKNIDTFQIASVDIAKALVIVDDTALYESNDWGANWKEVGHDYPKLYGILTV